MSKATLDVTVLLREETLPAQDENKKDFKMKIIRHKLFTSHCHDTMEMKVQGLLTGDYLFEYCLEFPSQLRTSQMIELGEILQEAFLKCEKIINKEENTSRES